MNSRIVMIGTAPEARGGVAALVRVYQAHGLLARAQVEYVPSHRDGGKLLKLGVAIRAWLAVMARLLARRVALLHVHLASDASFWRKSLFIVPAHFMGVQYVLHMHGGDFPRFYARARWPGRQPFIRWIYHRARHVIALSTEWRAAILAMAPAARVSVIPNPVEIPAAQASLASTPPTVLFMGVLEERKGVHDLLRAWSAVREAFPEARLVLAGSGARESVEALARELGIAASVDMPGWVSPAECARLLQGASVFALPSHFEALPMAVLEAMAAGVPVVATRVGGIPMAVRDGESGLLLEPRDVAALSAALERLLGDPGMRRAMGSAARARAVENFSADVLIPRLESLWRESLPPALPSATTAPSPSGPDSAS